MSVGSRQRGGDWSNWGRLLVLLGAGAFPFGLMIWNPTLMFERGWEQYAGTAIYVWALAMLGREWRRRAKDGAGFAKAADWLERATFGEGIGTRESAVLPSRLRRLRGHCSAGIAPGVSRLMELNGEFSGLDQEQTAGRYVLTKYILYLLPVIGFIGTVEGISHALMNIGKVLPMVKDLDGFMSNLTSVTSALQVAFDSTLLALFLSAVLMLVQTMTYRAAESHLAEVDAWVVEHVLPKWCEAEGSERDAAAAAVERLRVELGSALGVGFGPHVTRFSESVERLAQATPAFEKGSKALRDVGDGLSESGKTVEAVRQLGVTLERIEAGIESQRVVGERLEAIRRGLERSNTSLESMADQWASAFERSSRTSQEQLGRTMSSLRDALELLQVSIEQGNSLYRSIVKRMFDDRAGMGPMSDEERAKAA